VFCDYAAEENRREVSPALDGKIDSNTGGTALGRNLYVHIVKLSLCLTN
jgi:hypothetical protein